MTYNYQNGETFYERVKDPREINVVEMIKTRDERRAALPLVQDDHVCVQSLEARLASVTKELTEVKNANLLREVKELLTAGGDVTLSGPLSLAETLQVSAATTMDLAGQDIVLGKASVGDGIFCVPAGGSLTIKGTGKVEVAEAAEDNFAMAIWVNGGDVIIEGGTFLNDAITGPDDQYDLIYVKGGSLTIKGGTFKSKTPKWTINKHDKTDCTIRVEGGTFFEYDPSVSQSENPVANFVPEGYKVVSEVREDGTWYTVVAE